MDDATRHALLQLLGNAMSGISEECWYAGWCGGAEDDIPELCRRALESGQSQPWGHGDVTPVQARGLVYPAAQMGYWATLGEAGFGYAPHQPRPLSLERLAALDQ